MWSISFYIILELIEGIFFFFLWSKVFILVMNAEKVDAFSVGNQIY